MNKLDNTSDFNNELFKLYNSEPDKISDFIGYWNSNFNKNIRTNKKNLLNLIRNLLSLSLEQVNLIDYMQNLDVFDNVSRCWIREFNENAKITDVLHNEKYSVMLDLSEECEQFQKSLMEDDLYTLV